MPTSTKLTKQLQGVWKNKPLIKYAIYPVSNDIAKLKVYGLVQMEFCHILSKFCLKTFIGF